jgi:hypothetical protein
VQAPQKKLAEMADQMEEQNVAFAETPQSLPGMLQNQYLLVLPIQVFVLNAAVQRWFMKSLS